MIYGSLPVAYLRTVDLNEQIKSAQWSLHISQHRDVTYRCMNTASKKLHCTAPKLVYHTLCTMRESLGPAMFARTTNACWKPVGPDFVTTCTAAYVELLEHAALLVSFYLQIYTLKPQLPKLCGIRNPNPRCDDQLLNLCGIRVGTRARAWGPSCRQTCAPPSPSGTM